jgi:hypothetical protein
LLSP